MQHLVSYAASYLINEIFHHSRCSLSLCLSLSLSLPLSLSVSLSLCTFRQERGCEGCHKERYNASLNRFRFPQLWNFISSYIFHFQSYLLFLNTTSHFRFVQLFPLCPFSLCPTIPTLRRDVHPIDIQPIPLAQF